jgi:hypothetical protein
MLAAKMDLFMKKLEASSNVKTAKIMDVCMTCEVCGNVGHSGNDCPGTREEASFINNGNNNGFHNNNYKNQGWNSRLVRPALQVRPALPCGTSPVQSTPSPSSNTWTNDIHL